MAPLGMCRLALEAAGWDTKLALARLEAADGPLSAGPADDALPAPELARVLAPAQVLAKYKGLARELRDVSPGTLPRSLVWVTERASANPPIVAHWERHRYFLGAPFARSFANGRGASSGPRRTGGHLRLERDVGQAPHASPREESLLALYDARWVLARLASFARRAGTRVAVELRGVAGWVDARGPDDALERACARFLDEEASAPDIDATLESHLPERTRTLESHPPERTSRASIGALLDAHPRRREGVADCGWAEHYEMGLHLTERVLREVDLVEEPEETEPAAVTELMLAAAAVGIHELLAVRSRYRTTGPASFPDVLDRLLLEHGSRVIGGAWKEVSKDEARATWRAALKTSLAYRTALIEAEVAERLVERFIASFDDDALFFRNGTDTAYTPVLGTTLESGAAIVDTNAAGLLFVGDED